MNKTELKLKLEQYRINSKKIRAASYASLEKETPEQQQKRITRLMRPENYAEFFDYYFGVNSKLSLADAPTPEFHQYAYSRLWKRNDIIQMRQYFRGAGKSIQTNVGNLLHLKQNNQVFFGVLIGKNGDLAQILLSDLQIHLESNERIIKDFGKQVAYGHWKDGEFETIDGKHFKSLGLNQPFRGLRFGQHRPDFASVDDCEDREEAKNPNIIQKKGEKITGDLMKAFHLERGRLIVPNNYIVRGGLLDFITDKYKDKERFHLHRVNLRKADGSPSWPERYTREMVDKIDKNTDYYTSQREDYNNPIEEGKLFKNEWVKYASVHGNKRDWTGLILHWDLSYKKNGDYKAAALLGFGDGRITVLKEFCRKCDLIDAVQWHYNTVQEYESKGMGISCYYDATAAQETVFMPIFQAEAKRRNYYSLPLPAHVSTDKHLRIEATLTDVLFNGLLIWDEKLKDTPDHKRAIDQLLSFEKQTTAHDDYPDTLEGAVRIGRQSFAMSKEDTMMGGALIGHRSRTKGF